MRSFLAAAVLFLVACSSGSGGQGPGDGGTVGGSGGKPSGGAGGTSAGGGGGTNPSGGAGGTNPSGGSGGDGGAAGVDAGPIICSSDEVCITALSGDPCKSNIACDTASATCTFDTLDSDADGHPPVVCGGDDCDDSVATTYTGATETCNGADDDCDGSKDDGLNCPTCTPGGFYVLLDDSGSMSDTQPAPSRWETQKTGFASFINATESSVLSIAIQYFPLEPTPCTGASYATPALAMAQLPGGALAIEQSMATKGPSGGSVLTPPIEGAVTYMKTWAAANPTKKPAIIMITDGVGLQCTPTDTPAAAQAAAAAGYSGTPSIPTYVISLGPEAETATWNALAAAGGTSTAFNTGTTGAAAITQALSDIRKAVTGCK